MHVHIFMYIYMYICGEDFSLLRTFNAESNESDVGEELKNAFVGPWALVGRALVGRALMGLPGPFWAGL